MGMNMGGGGGLSHTRPPQLAVLPPPRLFPDPVGPRQHVAHGVHCGSGALLGPQGRPATDLPLVTLGGTVTLKLAAAEHLVKALVHGLTPALVH